MNMSGTGWRTGALGAAIALLLGSGVGAAVIKAQPSGASDGAVDQWDPRVAPIASWVAQERGLAFEHPVAVDFLTERQYLDEAGGSAGDLSPDERDEMARFTRFARALGLVTGDVDLAREGGDLAGEGTAAFYDPDGGRVLVRGTEMTPGLEVTLSHELTHVLQDQHFDLSQDFDTDGAQLAFHALAEGDAQRIEAAYVDSLDADEQGAYEAESDAQITQAEAQVDGISPALVSTFAAPYVLGDQLVGLLDDLNGQAGVNDAFRAPPGSGESLIDPFTYLAGDQPIAVDTPKLSSGEEEFDRADFGALTWLLVLGARIDHHVALQAVDGWGGDSYIGFERGDSSCVRAAFVGDTTNDTEEMGAALDQWVSVMPAGAASVTRTGARVQLEACDPGAGADLSFSPGYEHILALPAARADIAREFMSEGAPQADARCVGQRVVDNFTADELADPGALVEMPAFGDQVRRIVAECRSD